jgi:predicted Rossmann fold nucleotide-binding protein DprA/Smf involved in DNA uptake
MHLTASRVKKNNEISIKQRVIGLLENAEGPMHVDDITRALGVAAAAVSSVLVVLELRVSARQVGTMQFAVHCGQ